MGAGYARCPPGSILGLLLFLIFVNNLPKAAHPCTVNQYTDDTAIYTCDVNPCKPQVSSRLEADLWRIDSRIASNGLRINIAKAQFMIMSRRSMRDAADMVTVHVDVSEAPWCSGGQVIEPEETYLKSEAHVSG